jgi:hypothetical protein
MCALRQFWDKSRKVGVVKCYISYSVVGNNSFSRGYKTNLLAYWQGLTTGGLPTFVDVGNSFGAPTILIYI